jgi:hypothetical protein
MRIMIKCKESGQDVPTPFVVHDATAFKSMSIEKAAVICPHCKKVHSFDRSDAYVAPLPPFPK